MDTNNEKILKLAQEVMSYSHDTLRVELRFLDMALSQFDYVTIEDDTILTDGKNLVYNPKHILKNYYLASEIPTRDYLHIVFHCVFRHMYIDPSVDRTYWDLACDIAVENIITELGLRTTAANRELLQKPGLKNLKDALKLITAEKIYHYLQETQMPYEQAAQLRGVFYADNHEIWYMTESEKEERYGIGKGNGNDNRDDNEDKPRETPTTEVALQEAIWEDIAKQIEVDMETFGKKRGIRSGAMTQNLMEVNREKYDYAEFLKKFAVLGEVMKVNPDEFDHIFYTYGFQLYEKMPLIEPLEYKEVKRIRDFVIAVDTSGSTTMTILAKKFIQKTYNILQSQESFFEKFNLYIIQCDADIQHVDRITCREDFDNFLKIEKLYGGGGTDFRPVFSYVEKLLEEKAFTNLKGLIYFTDGQGIFPEKKPDYETAFVFVDDDYNNYDVPSWAIKLILESEDI